MVARLPRDFPEIIVLHGRALVPLRVESIYFIRAVGPHMRQEPGGHIVPLAGMVHGGGGRVPRPIAKCDIYHGAGSLGEVARPRSKQPSYADCEGDLLPCGKPVDPEAQVLGRRVFRLFAGAVGVALHTYDFPRLAKRCAARKFLTSYLGFCQLCPDSNGSDQPHHLFFFP